MKNLDKKELDIEIIDTKEEHPSKLKNNDSEIKSKGWLITILSYKPILYIFFFIAFMLIFTLTKDYIFSVIANNDQKKEVHTDNTNISFSTNGFKDIILIDKKKASAVVLRQLKKLEDHKKIQVGKFQIDLKRIIDEEFISSYEDIELFADWFYQYTTQYKILYEASKGIVNDYRAGLSDYKILDSATIQVKNYIALKYKDIVLKPHLLEPSLRLKLENLLTSYANNKNEFVNNINNEFEIYLSLNPDNLSATSLEIIKADWNSNIKNSTNVITLKDKDATGALTTGAASAATGKVLSGTAGKTVATKVMGKFSFSKVITAMVAKVGTVPLTFGLSLAAGALIDYGLNEIDESASRESFTEDVNRNLTNMKDEIYFKIMNQNILQTMYNKDINLYKDFVND